jgi:hypothetical protein
MMQPDQPAGAAMRLVIALFVLAVLVTAASSVGLSIWDGRLRLNDRTLRAIHYDTQYDLSSQRRVPAEQRD